MVKKVFLAISLICFFSCNKSKIKISNFKPISNIRCNDSNFIYLPMDLNGTINTGIVIPSKAQKKKGFVFTAEVQNKSEKKLFYKIFYQNSSYKFNEVKKLGVYDTLCAENFYGSWISDVSLFKEVKGNSIKDTFRIYGNPLNDKKYYDYQKDSKEISESQVIATMNNIKSNEEWFSQVVEKANKNKSTIEMQLRNDAVWIVENTVDESLPMVNNRWKRNPRVGFYEFMLVVLTEDALNNLPSFIRDIRKENMNGFRVNPFYYFLYSEDRKNPEIAVSYRDDYLKTSAKLKASNNIYIDYSDLVRYNISDSLFCEVCNSSEELAKNAIFKQFFSHKELQGFSLDNVPIIADVLNDPYTAQDYFNNKEKYNNERVQKFITESGSACKTAYYDKDKDGIVIINPGSDSAYNKESVGIAARIGFTYGKFTGKIKFTELMNEENVWNGMTNAFWLIFQGGDWNKRRPVKKGYLDSYVEGVEKLVNDATYSEIDIEIIKASKNWPKTSYGSNAKFDEDYDAAESDDIIIACTNWDLACRDVKSFVKGAKEYSFNGKKYILHRWDDWYKAITSKYPHNEDEIFKKDYYFFQIDWQPEKIIWRIGPTNDSLFTICEMTEKVTSIPNNQMIPVITQEWHYDKFWPTAPFSQDNIPFPKNDLEGVVFDITVE